MTALHETITIANSRATSSCSCSCRRESGYPGSVQVKTFDHVALWVDERDALARLLTDCCDMHVIERTDDFTLVGGDAREGKLTLFAAEGRRETGVLDHVGLSVPDLESTAARIDAAGFPVGNSDGEELLVQAPAGLSLGLVQGWPGSVPDLDHVVLSVPEPASTAEVLTSLGLENGDDGLHVANRRLVLRHGETRASDRPLLNHLAFLVDSADDARNEARSLGVAIDREVDAANTRAVFVEGPDGIVLEYVERKPGFSLR